MQWTVAIGVDTHKDVHVAVAFDALGAQIGKGAYVTRMPPSAAAASRPPISASPSATTTSALRARKSSASTRAGSSCPSPILAVSTSTRTAA
jgi:hypothetical protein